jgi:hypothetical protein
MPAARDRSVIDFLAVTGNLIVIVVVGGLCFIISSVLGNKKIRLENGRKVAIKNLYYTHYVPDLCPINGIVPQRLRSYTMVKLICSFRNKTRVMMSLLCSFISVFPPRARGSFGEKGSNSNLLESFPHGRVVHSDGSILQRLQDVFPPRARGS